jgi:hypothetical protein
MPAAAAAAAAAASSSGEGPTGGAGFFATAFLAGAFFTGAAVASPPAAGKASFSFLTTGASIVEDAERTNSPMSCSLVTRTLLSTPSSLASS